MDDERMINVCIYGDESHFNLDLMNANAESFHSVVYVQSENHRVDFQYSMQREHLAYSPFWPRRNKKQDFEG